MTACAPDWLPAQPYADEDDLLCGECTGIDYSTAVWDWAKLAASRRVFELTGGAFPGTMRSRIRPCRQFCSTTAERLAQNSALSRARYPAMPYLVDDAPAPMLVNLWACECGWDPCTCTKRDAIVLPYRPVCEVVEVKIDGAVFTAWSLVGARLYRTDGLLWPTCNAPEPDSEPGTWSVTFTHGQSLPPEGVPLVAEYACQLAKKACKKPCDLPDGIRVVSRGSTQYAIEDTKYRGELLTGFTPLDDWMVSVLGGPRRARERPRMWTRGRQQQRAGHRLEHREAQPIDYGDAPMRETLHLRNNEDRVKTVSYPGKVLEAGHLVVVDPDGNAIIDVLATIIDGTAYFNIAASSWVHPGDLPGRWDMIVKPVGGGWDVVAAGPVRFYDGVAEPVP